MFRHKPTRKVSKKLIAVTVLVFIIAGVTGGFLVYKRQDKPAQNQGSGNPEKAAEKTAVPKTTVRILAAGDMLPHDAINAAAKTSNGYDYLPLMKNFQTYFQRADVRFCVQGVPGGGEAFKITGYPVFNAPIEFTRDMALLGCNVINTGTNHSNDKGQPLIDATLDAWDKQPNILAVAGANRSAAEQQKIRYFQSGGLKFALLSYVTYDNTHDGTAYGVNTFSEAVATRELAEARTQADIIIVSMRWGTEYSPAINSLQERLGVFLADNGADVVFGHGQHVQGPVKRLPRKGGGETVVWYGIGNFINAQLPPDTLFNGVPIVDVDIATKKVTALSFLPFYMHYEWTAAQKASEDLLARKNFMMYTLDQAQAPLAKSQNATTIADQTTRLKTVLNQFTSVSLLDPNQY